MSNENSNLRVGSAGAGLFVGSTEILGGVSNIIDNNYTAPCKVVVINNSDKTLNAYFYFINGDDDIPFSLEPNGVLYKSFDAYKDTYLRLSDNINQTMNVVVSYGYNDGTPTVDSSNSNGETEIQFMGDNEIKATYVCIITQINGQF